MKRSARFYFPALLLAVGASIAAGCGDSFRTCERLRTCVVPEAEAGDLGWAPLAAEVRRGAQLVTVATA